MKIKICKDLRTCNLRYQIQSHFEEISRVKFDKFTFFDGSIGSIELIDSSIQDLIACEDFRRLLKEGTIKIIV